MGLRAAALALTVGLVAGIGAGRAGADPRGAKGIQHVYERGVPQVDRNGRPMDRYEAGRSFFPIGVWGVVLPDAAGGPYFGWEEFAKAGFNTVWPFNWDARALWEMAGEINGELKGLTPVLLSPTVGADYRYDVDVKGQAVTETPIRSVLKPHPDGGYVLMVVNVDDAVLDVTFTFPQKLKSAAVMFENGGALGLDPSGTKFHERFEPFDTHVYREIPAAGSAGR